MAENILLPSYTGITALTDLGIYALAIPTTEEMYNRWHGNGDNSITGNIFVEFDGVTYECAQQRLTELDGGVAVGNCTAFGGTGNNEPFIITIIAGTNQDEYGNVTAIYVWMIAALTDTAPAEHTVEVYQVEASTAFAVVLKDRSGANVTYEVPSEQIKLNTPDGTQIFTAGQAVENVPITLDLADGDQTVTAGSGQLIKSAVIQKPATLVPANIVKDVDIAGVVGTFEGSGGSDTEISPTDVVFYDYDGTILYQYTRAQADALSELPPLPTQDGLICQGWNYTLDEIREIEGAIDVGAMYITDDGKTRIYINLTDSTKLACFLWCAGVSGSVSVKIDWGDGTSTTHTYASASATTNTCPTKAYSSVGKYCITLTTQSAIYLGGKPSYTNNNIFGSGSGSFNNWVITKVHIGNNVQGLSGGAFVGAYQLKGITIPYGVTELQKRPVAYNSTVPHITYPRGITTWGVDYIKERNVPFLKSVSIPPDIATSIRVQYDYSAPMNVRRVIPRGITTLTMDVIHGEICTAPKVNSYGVNIISDETKTLILPEGVTTWSGMAQYHNVETIILPSTLTSVSFSNLYLLIGGAKIYVPDNMLDTFKSMTNLSNLASVIFPYSEIPTD